MSPQHNSTNYTCLICRVEVKLTCILQKLPCSIASRHGSTFLPTAKIQHPGLRGHPGATEKKNNFAFSGNLCNRFYTVHLIISSDKTIMCRIYSYLTSAAEALFLLLNLPTAVITEGRFCRNPFKQFRCRFCIDVLPPAERFNCIYVHPQHIRDCFVPFPFGS